MKERRKAPRKNWVISKDDVGRSVLEWQPDPIRAKRMEADPNARTYDFLNRLDHPELAIEDDGNKPQPVAQLQPLRSRRLGGQTQEAARITKPETADFGSPKRKNPRPYDRGFCIKSLAMTYSRMG